MKFEKDITIDVNVLKQDQHGIILEVKFSGIHDHSWPNGKEIYAFLEAAVEKYKPDAVLLDYSKYKYSFGNELGATILIPIMDFKQNRLRPCAIIAEGSTKNSIQSLIYAGGMTQKEFNLAVLTDKAEALEQLKNELSGT